MILFCIENIDLVFSQENKFSWEYGLSKIMLVQNLACITLIWQLQLASCTI